ncbi:MAG: 1-(5-phosphoribosyl)-5-[(5-phosphoribosylamino)methylideneamino] imidazole-4-carboxamide isomerase [Leptospiraceae bacterium]|nr:1-(5-phosphoribosyl)-5-[(5-phosphoribosylamino)methylideneamino] imidazole-4-carboxamide isomerase [Leptospiraceae bacterium]MDW8307263.1 1-(5-phosphoribosyl)-5-[(5-phosphoribosylamino)methylideneamino] imidazole-4-carboxamide isomerase [Leptospiraceae bacterium]
MLAIISIDLLDHAVVRLAKGNFNQVTVYDKNPLLLARRLAQEGLKRVHVVDLSGARVGSPQHRELIVKIKKETNLSLQVGGGIRSLADVQQYFDAGLKNNEDFVVLGSLPFQDSHTFYKIWQRYPNNIILAVDVWGREIRTEGWEKKASAELFPFLRDMYELGIRHFLVTQIKKDGMLSGPDFSLYGDILEKFTELKLYASGGIRDIEDLKRLKQLGLYGAIIGRAFYEGKISLEALGCL